MREPPSKRIKKSSSLPTHQQQQQHPLSTSTTTQQTQQQQQQNTKKKGKRNNFVKMKNTPARKGSGGGARYRAKGSFQSSRNSHYVLAFLFYLKRREREEREEREREERGERERRERRGEMRRERKRNMICFFLFLGADSFLFRWNGGFALKNQKKNKFGLIFISKKILLKLFEQN